MSKLLSILIAACLLVLLAPMGNIQAAANTANTAANALQAGSCADDYCFYLPKVTFFIPASGQKACLVTDTGGVNDQSFNGLAWQGHTMARDKLGVTIAYRESATQADYAKNINAFIQEKCSLITTVGFLLGDPTKAAALAHPAQKFAIVDFAYDPAVSNVRGITFDVSQPAFLAGYLAAGTTKTGKIGTFGGIQIPTVTLFMDGYALGAQYYNQQHGTQVQVLGWNPASQQGLFINDFSDTNKGKSTAQALMDEGADIILPVAGTASLGAADAVKTAGNAWIIGVDSDWTISEPAYKDFVLTSVMKQINNATFTAIADLVSSRFTGGNYTGTLKNGGTGLGAIDGSASADLLAELEQVKSGIIAGTIPTVP